MQINKIAIPIWKNVKALGCEVGTKKNITMKIKEELKEFNDSKVTVSNKELFRISNIQDDEEFKEEFNKIIKGSIQEELPDLISPVFCYAIENNIDIELCMLIKDRFNSMRNKND